MGFLDKAKKLVAKNDQQVKKAIDKAADLADKKTGGKHSKQIDDLAAKAEDAVEKLPEK
jgi:ABC-type transporter Mla subunit MlaD